jgi:LuxR family quorum sensing-dependent transcriptional regulator
LRGDAMGGSSSEFVQEAFEIMDQLESLRDPAPMIDRVAGWLAQFGHDTFLITGMPAPHRERLEPYILLNHWPMEWYDRYTSENHYRADPVARHCFATIQPFAWSELPSSSLTSAAALRVMSEASDCGLREGLCIPLHDVHGFQAAVTRAGERPELPPEARRMVHLLALYAYSAAERLGRGDHRGAPLDAQLSTREREILKWTALGKTSWATGRILDISEFTVNAHLRNARRKLGTCNNVHTVVEALRRHEIRL